MEKFTFGQNNNESLAEELLRRTREFINNSRKMLALDIPNISLVDKLLEAINAYRDALIQMTPKSDEEGAQIKTTLQDLSDLESICIKRKTLH